ncbi:MAG: hypothetical protein QM760_01220 [Nibricoccus sp.]
MEVRRIFRHFDAVFDPQSARASSRRTSLAHVAVPYREERARLIWGAVLYIIKHSPVWVMPLVTARIVDIVAKPEAHSLNEPWVNAAILLAILIQNIPTDYLCVRSISQAARSTIRLRSAICRPLRAKPLLDRLFAQSAASFKPRCS